MWTSYSLGIDSVTRSTSSALIFTILSQIFFTRQSELWSELLSWVLIPIIFKVTEQPDIRSHIKWTHSSNTASTSSSLSMWVVAICLSVSSLYKAERGLIRLYPILVPLLLATQAYIRSEISPNSSHQWPSASFFWLSVASGAFAIVTLSHENMVHSALSAIAVAAQLLVYGTLLHGDGTRLQFLPHVHNIEATVVPLARRIIFAMFVAIALQTIVFGFTADRIAPMFVLAVLKALSWYFVAQTAQHTSWTIAPLIYTFALLSTLNPFHQSSSARALSSVIASLLTLTQVIYLLTKQSKLRYYLWVFSLVSLIPYLTNIWAIQSARSDAGLTYTKFPNHPVEMLIEKGRMEFEGMLQKQSKSYKAAAEEYRHRYHVNPPPGFEAWYDFAVSHESPLVDDFDTIYRSVSPFWRVNGKQMAQVMEDAYTNPGSELWLCEFERLGGKTKCRHAWRKFDRHIELLFDRLLDGLKGVIPDVKFLVNHLDEPRVVLPPSSQEAGVGQFNLTNLSHQSTWDALTKSCLHSSYNDNITINNPVDTFDLPFVTSHSASLNLCHHFDYRNTHGLFQSPTSLRLISGFIPVLSTGAPSTMGDILFPSPAYLEEEFQYDEEKDVPWDKKSNDVFWAGSTTGGFAENDGWRNFHRQRFVTLAQGIERKRHTYLRKTDGVVKRVESSFLNNRLFHVAFTRIFQCEAKYCRDQKAYFRTRSWTDRNCALQSRLAFDLDGNGISGRYYQLLASKSVPLKQTLLREWHDDRLVPWVHYIPVSQSMEELPELVSYLTLSETGQNRAREIAEAGSVWYSKAFRDVDMSIYLYRLLLELARLQDLDRPSGIFQE